MEPNRGAASRRQEPRRVVPGGAIGGHGGSAPAPFTAPKANVRRMRAETRAQTRGSWLRRRLGAARSLDGLHHAVHETAPRGGDGVADVLRVVVRVGGGRGGGHAARVLQNRAWEGLSGLGTLRHGCGPQAGLAQAVPHPPPRAPVQGPTPGRAVPPPSFPPSWSSLRPVGRRVRRPLPARPKPIQRQAGERSADAGAPGCTGS